MTDPATARTGLRSRVIAEIVAANPEGRLKAVEYDQYGALRRIEWHDDPAPDEPIPSVVERVCAYTEPK